MQIDEGDIEQAYKKCPGNSWNATPFGICATVDAHSKAKKGVDALEGEVICGHVCGKHAEVMDPRLWSILPESLLELSFGRLLPHRIDEVHLFSKAWKSAVCTHTVFQGQCSQASTSMFAITDNNVGGACFDNRMFDFNWNWWRWKYFELDDGRSLFRMIRVTQSLFMKCGGGSTLMNLQETSNSLLFWPFDFKSTSFDFIT